MAIPPDIEIAQGAKLKPITEIAAGLGLTEDDIELYGKYKAKINPNVLKLSLIHISEPTRPY